MTLTPAEVLVARRALGLPNPQSIARQHHARSGKRHADHAIWLGLVKRGLATRDDGPFGDPDRFELTREAALAVLERGERLDPTDWPERA